MANGPPTISYLMSRVTPFQDNLMRYLNRSDLNAMSHAAIPVPLSKTVQRKNLLHVRCEQKSDTPPHRRCRNKSMHRVRMRDCLGGWYNEGIGDDPPPTKDESGYWNALEQVDHEPGFEICEDCRVEYYNAFAQLEMDDIANEFWVGMCKRHSLEHFRRRPIMNYCRCFDLLDGSWQCNECRIDTFGTLEMRMDAWKSELLYMRCKRGRRGRVLADRTERRVHPACPIPKCGGRPWMNESAIERMDMCTACCGVQPYLWYDQAQQMEE